MPMQAESLEVLEKASVAPAQARAIVRAIEIEIAGAKDTLATKTDVLVLRQEVDASRIEVRSEMRELGAALRGEMAQLATELRAEMKELGAELRVDIHSAVGGAARQMYVAILGQMAVLLGFFYFFLVQLRA